MDMIFRVIFPIVLGTIGLFLFGFAIIAFFRPKSREKFMEQQIKAAKNMIDGNQDILKEMAKQNAEILSDGIEIKARALKKGFSDKVETNQIFCRYCGKTIDENSKFCKYCGKEQ